MKPIAAILMCIIALFLISSMLGGGGDSTSSTSPTGSSLGDETEKARAMDDCATRVVRLPGSTTTDVAMREFDSCMQSKGYRWSGGQRGSGS